jgi:hypothetical protein
VAGKGRPKGQSNTERESMSAVRLAQVEEALLAGRSHSWCMETYAEAWGVTERQVQNYLARVEAQWRERAPTATPELRAQARERVQMLMRTALASNADGVPGALGAAMKAADMLNKIDGVYAPEKVEHSGAVDVTAMTPAQRRARMDELLAKRGS